MRVRVVSVGKPRDRAFDELHDRYAARIRRFGVSYQTAWVAESSGDARYSPEHAMQREAGALLEAVRPKATLVALTPQGSLLTSEQLAERLERWATPALELLVGGPHGLHRDVLERANTRLSLSPLTFPHEMVRLLLAEQLYRALSILRGVPYHK